MLGVCLSFFSILEIFNGHFLVKVQDKKMFGKCFRFIQVVLHSKLSWGVVVML